MRILVATDGSDPAAVGCEQARSIAQLVGGEIRIVAVQPPTSDLFGGPWPAAVAFDPMPVIAAVREHLGRRVAEECARTPSALNPTSAVLQGRPADAIVSEALRWDADLIVVGSRGHGSLATILLGSVSEEVVDHSPVPVLVARRPDVHRVVVAVDDSPASRSGVEFLAVGGRFPGLQAHVVDVVPGRYPWWVGLSSLDGESVEQMSVMIDAAERSQAAAAEAAASSLRDAGLPTMTHRRVGDPADEILRAAVEVDADVVVIGSRGQTGVTRLVLGSVARHVLRHATASVLVVHPPTAPGRENARAAAAPSREPATVAAAVHPREEVQTGASAVLEKETTMKILLAYDGGEPADRALKTAARMATAMGGSVDVISVVPFHSGRVPVDPWDDRTVHLAELEKARQRLEEMGVPCKLLIPIPAGEPAPEIEAAAREGDYDMIVVGSRRQGVLGRVLLGSVSEHVATHADATVVIAR